MFDGIDRFIAGTLRQSASCRFVFPSQVVADSRLARALQYGAAAALRKDRFISWDTFKEKVFDESRKQRPVNGALRMLFATALLDENSKSSPPLFQRLVPVDYAELSRSYRSLVTAILPRLDGFLRELDGSGLRERFPRALITDIDLLASRYGRFLSERNLFEPGAALPEPRPLPGISWILFPEVLEDFSEYESSLSRCEEIRTLDTGDYLRSDDSNHPVLLRYRTAAAELAALIERIAALLQSGADPREIAITLPDDREWRPRLAAAAADRSIPLRFRGGEPLSESVPGRFFRALWETSSGDWAFDQVENLFMNQAVPWRSAGLVRRIVRFGRDYFCHKGARLWEQTLSRAERPVLASTFVSLRDGIRQLTGAESFALLRDRMQPFLRTHIDPDGWADDDLPVLQRCLESLGELAEAEASAGLGELGAVFPLWLSYLEGRQYVRRQERMGISVYQYRVSAGISPKYHFLPGCGQEKSRVLLHRYSFLSEEERKQLSGSEKDLSSAFLELYASAGSGAEISFADEGFGGPDLPPSELIDYERPGEQSGDERFSDPFTHEIFYWTGGMLPARLWPLQQKGLLRYLATGGAGKRVDFTVRKVEDVNLLRSLLSRLSGGRDEIEISPAMLEAFWSCPFAFLADRCLKAREPELELRFTDPRIVGNLFHTAAARFFSDTSAEDADERMEQLLSRLFSSWHRGPEPVPLPPVAGAMERFVRAGAKALVREFYDHFSSFRPMAVEKGMKSPRKGRGISLEDDRWKISMSGRPDWIGRSASSYLIIDYKKRLFWKKGQLLPDDESLPQSFQMALYRSLLRENGFGEAAAAYFDMTSGLFQPVCGTEEKQWFDDEQSRLLSDRLDQALDAMTAALEDGSFFLPSGHCDGCSLRGACRMRFHMKDVRCR
ncbi:PD-(D/E)XK nuclease family protein [Sediminispirochaeta bajacaliforniensis]|uniref:PD-(D/E)XK nuclease family protein n=1 Tax=Sediminispirochaeta bajacaliforniensis TaxID=148 RepID=UPI000371B4D6|nr:PD-(D/E)XK nuclease family protein [Sediminispirochaeta bajacaliforniensis]